MIAGTVATTEEICMYANAIPNWMVGIEKDGGYTIAWYVWSLSVARFRNTRLWG